jgi:hypothetical protein
MPLSNVLRKILKISQLYRKTHYLMLCKNVKQNSTPLPERKYLGIHRRNSRGKWKERCILLRF